MRRTLPILAATLTLFSAGVAEAQDRSLGRGIQFVLKPRSGMAIRSAATPLDADSQNRMTRLAAVPVQDRGHELKMTVSRRKLRFAGPMLTPPSDFAPRSRMVLLTIEDRMNAGDQVRVMAGAQGGKLSNRGANVTAIASSGPIRTRDWFMPRATVEITPLPALSIALDYRETWRAYGETGSSGPMGLRDDEFRTWAGALKAETRHRLRFNSSWTPSPETALTLAAIDGAIENRLSFARRSYLPVNIGSARLTGLELAAVHQASPHWRLSMRYSKAWIDRADEGQARESSLSAEAGWSSGPWRGMVRTTRSSRPALAELGSNNRRMRMEGEMRYQLPAAAIALRLTDPDLLASTALLRDDPAGPVRAADQARVLMAEVALAW